MFGYSLKLPTEDSENAVSACRCWSTGTTAIVLKRSRSAALVVADDDGVLIGEVLLPIEVDKEGIKISALSPSADGPRWILSSAGVAWCVTRKEYVRLQLPPAAGHAYVLHDVVVHNGDTVVAIGSLDGQPMVEVRSFNVDSPALLQGTSSRFPASSGQRHSVHFFSPETDPLCIAVSSEESVLSLAWVQERRSLFIATLDDNNVVVHQLYWTASAEEPADLGTVHANIVPLDYSNSAEQLHLFNDGKGRFIFERAAQLCDSIPGMLGCSPIGVILDVRDEPHTCRLLAHDESSNTITMNGATLALGDSPCVTSSWNREIVQTGPTQAVGMLKIQGGSRLIGFSLRDTTSNETTVSILGVRSLVAGSNGTSVQLAQKILFQSNSLPLGEQLDLLESLTDRRLCDTSLLVKIVGRIMESSVGAVATEHQLHRLEKLLLSSVGTDSLPDIKLRALNLLSLQRKFPHVFHPVARVVLRFVAHPSTEGPFDNLLLHFKTGFDDISSWQVLSYVLCLGTANGDGVDFLVECEAEIAVLSLRRDPASGVVPAVNNATLCWVLAAASRTEMPLSWNIDWRSIALPVLLHPRISDAMFASCVNTLATFFDTKATKLSQFLRSTRPDILKVVLSGVATLQELSGVVDGQVSRLDPWAETVVENATDSEAIAALAKMLPADELVLNRNASCALLRSATAVYLQWNTDEDCFLDLESLLPVFNWNDAQVISSLINGMKDVLWHYATDAAGYRWSPQELRVLQRAATVARILLMQLPNTAWRANEITARLLAIVDFICEAVSGADVALEDNIAKRPSSLDHDYSSSDEDSIEEAGKSDASFSSAVEQQVYCQYVALVGETRRDVITLVLSPWPEVLVAMLEPLETPPSAHILLRLCDVLWKEATKSLVVVKSMMMKCRQPEDRPLWRGYVDAFSQLAGVSAAGLSLALAGALPQAPEGVHDFLSSCGDDDETNFPYHEQPDDKVSSSAPQTWSVEYVASIRHCQSGGLDVTKECRAEQSSHDHDRLLSKLERTERSERDVIFAEHSRWYSLHLHDYRLKLIEGLAILRLKEAGCCSVAATMTMLHEANSSLLLQLQSTHLSQWKGELHRFLAEEQRHRWESFLSGRDILVDEELAERAKSSEEWNATVERLRRVFTMQTDLLQLQSADRLALVADEISERQKLSDMAAESEFRVSEKVERLRAKRDADRRKFELNWHSKRIKDIALAEIEHRAEIAKHCLASQGSIAIQDLCKTFYTNAMQTVIAQSFLDVSELMLSETVIVHETFYLQITGRESLAFNEIRKAHASRVEALVARQVSVLEGEATRSKVLKQMAHIQEVNDLQRGSLGIAADLEYFNLLEHHERQVRMLQALHPQNAPGASPIVDDDDDDEWDEWGTHASTKVDHTAPQGVPHGVPVGRQVDDDNDQEEEEEEWDDWDASQPPTAEGGIQNSILISTLWPGFEEGREDIEASEVECWSKLKRLFDAGKLRLQRKK